MSNSDFVRYLPGGMEHFGKPPGVWAKIHLDPVLLFLLMVLAGCGLFVLYSGSGESIEYVEKQGIRFGLAFLVMFVFAQLEPSVYRRWAPVLYVVGVIALVAVLVSGIGAKGAQRWLKLPGIPRFQPSEIMKLALPLVVAAYYSSKVLPPSLRHILVSFVIMLIPVALIIKQPDLGTSLLILASGIFVVFFAGLSWKYIGGFVAVVAAALPVLWTWVMHDYQKQRVLTFLNPERDPLGTGWNIIQSKTAIGSGGVYGKGWLLGTQSQLDFLPESHTDFIIAVLAEEFGFVGVCLLLSVYLLIILRGMMIAYNAQDTFGRLVAASITLTFFVYVFVNIGMVSGLLPVVGVPLPLISYGGTSIITLMAAFGVLMSIGTHRKMLSN